jgi:hypothetical protein
MIDRWRPHAQKCNVTPPAAATAAAAAAAERAGRSASTSVPRTSLRAVKLFFLCKSEIERTRDRRALVGSEAFEMVLRTHATKILARLSCCLDERVRLRLQSAQPLQAAAQALRAQLSLATSSRFWILKARCRQRA